MGITGWDAYWMDKDNTMTRKNELAAARLAGKIEGMEEALVICEGTPLPGGGPFRHNEGWAGNWVTDGDTARTRGRCAEIIRAKIAELKKET